MKSSAAVLLFESPCLGPSVRASVLVSLLDLENLSPSTLGHQLRNWFWDGP